MAANVLVTWELPTPSPSQRPLQAVEIAARVVGAPDFTVLNTVDVPTTELAVQDVASGDWEFRGIVLDTADDRSAPVFGTVSVPFDGPSPLESLSVNLS